jgi:F0F1-type ATP synthase assembly protein I
MNKNQLPPKQPNSFLRFSNLAIQMGAIIGLSAWGGTKLDAYFNTTEPYYTITASLLGIGAALYIVIKDVISSSKNEDET